MSAQAGGSILLDYRPQPAQAQPGGNILLDYAAAAQVRRLLRSAIEVPWVLAALERTPTANPFGVTEQLDPATAAPWAIAAPQATGTAAPWLVTTPTDTERAAPWGTYNSRQPSPARSAWGVTTPTDIERRAPWGTYGGRPATALRPVWVSPLFADRHAVAPWGIYSTAQSLMAAVIGPSAGRDSRAEIPWDRFSRPLATNWGIPTEPNEPPIDENGTLIVPTLRSYIVVNNVILRRVSNDLALQPLTLNISIDWQTWGWGWSTTLPARALPDLERDTPHEPVELEAVINGALWRLLVERITRDRRFGQDRIAVSGRGIAAQIADPHYAPEARDNTAGAATAQQLADAALTLNGVSIGWALDWQMRDWLVPAGAWVHTGTPIEAVVRIAQAGGGYVQADPLAKTLHVLPGYPVLPWALAAATPDISLPSAATTREGVEYIERPDYNQVIVSGSEVGGIIGTVRRTGTAGDLNAELIVDPLITHVDAARGRGELILGQAGTWQRVTLETPLFENTGLYPVGAILDYTDGATTRRGIVRSVSVTATHPTVRQTLEVEIHE
jgi:hypothetical protein